MEILLLTSLVLAAMDKPKPAIAIFVGCGAYASYYLHKNKRESLRGSVR